MHGIWRIVCLLALAFGLATPGFAQVPKPVHKPTVAVATFKDPTNSGQAETLKTMIETAVTETGKFRIIEREFSQLETEQALARSGRVTTNRPGRSGGFEGVDFLIYGKITAASGGRQTDVVANMGIETAKSLPLPFGLPLGSLGGGSCNRMVASFAVDVKIVDTVTGEAKFAKPLNEHASSGTSCGGEASLDMPALMRKIANQTAMGLAITMYPIKVAAVLPDGVFMLNYGEGALTIGTVLGVYGQGTDVPDPDTGVVMTTEGAEIGRIRVTEVNTRFSKAVPLTTFASPPPRGTVVRVLADQSGKAGRWH